MDNAYQYQDYPKWMYGPNGESSIFESEADVPKGWKDHPSKLNTSKKDSESQNDVVADSPQSEAPASPANEDATTPVEASESNVTPELTHEYLSGLKMSKLWEMASELNVDRSGKKPELVEKIFNALEEAKKK